MHIKVNLVKTYLILLLSLLFVSCAQPARDPQQAKSPAVEPIVWPSPPLPPRIRFVNSVASPVDLGIKPSMPKWLSRLISGQEEAWFIRPAGVSVRQGVIYVADPGAQCLWVLNPRAGKFKQLRTADEESLVSPVAVAVGPNQSVYLVDSYLAKIFAYNNNGERVATIGHGELQRPAGVAFDEAADRLYVADSAAHRALRWWSLPGYLYREHLHERLCSLSRLPELQMPVAVSRRRGTSSRGCSCHGTG